MAPCPTELQDVYKRQRIDIFITLEEAGESLTTVKINRNITDAYIAIARQLSDDLELSWDIGVTGFLSLPGVLELTSMEVDSEEIWGLIEQSADQAMTELKEMRAKEGQFLVRDIVNRTEYIEAVSYTHLDVYKRQAGIEPAKPCRDLDAEDRRRLIDALMSLADSIRDETFLPCPSKSLDSMYSIKPVSYTHLDVYKRQSPTSPRVFPFPFCPGSGWHYCTRARF